MLRSVRALSLAFALGLLASCDGSPSDSSPRVAVVSLGKTELNVVPLQDVQLFPDARDADGNPVAGRQVRWATDDSTFVTISSTGVIRALRPGRGAVSVTVDGAVAVVHVLAYTERLQVWPDTVALLPGATSALAARARPNGAEPALLDRVVWESSNPAVARVDSMGNVTAVANGRATITAIVGPVRMLAESNVFSYPRPLRFATVEAGSTHACGVTTEGDAYCWGGGDYAQLGTAVLTNRCETFYRDTHGVVGHSVNRCSAVPLPVDGGVKFASLSVGSNETCGLTPAGAAYCWGGPRLLVFSDAAGGLTPAPVPGNRVFRSISVGAGMTCGVTPSDAAYCWGEVSSGSLGDGTSSSSAVPVAVAGGLAFASVSAGEHHACGLTTAGEAYCWGRNDTGELGAPGPDLCAPANRECARRPVKADTPVRFRSIVAGGNGSCALDAAGRAYCWGTGTGAGALPAATLPSRVPVAVYGDLSFTMLSRSSATCGLVAGAAYCWGTPAAIPGNSGREDPVPVRAAPSLALRSISVGGNVSCGIAVDGIAYCWGVATAGQLGNGVYTSAINAEARVLGQ